MASTATAFSINVPIIIGIALGSAFVLCALCSSVIILVVRRRHRRALANIENDARRRQTNALDSSLTVVAHPQMTLRKSINLPNSRRIGWGALSSREDLRQDATRTNSKCESEKRPSDMLSWPLKSGAQGQCPIEEAENTSSFVDY